MERPRAQKLVKLDGKTGEGGGQLVRVAVALAALTGTPLRIDNVRGNRPGKRGGGEHYSSTLNPFRWSLIRSSGLKQQHVSCIRCLAEATNAEVNGCSVGSKSIEFKARRSPTDLVNRNIRVKAESAASILLVFQAILPFLLFAGNEKGSPITASIHGGTNVSFSLSFEYLDQVLLPALDRKSVV